MRSISATDCGQSSLHVDSVCCRDAAKIEKSVVVLKEETRGGRHVGWDVGGAAGSPRGFAVLIGEESSLVR